MAATASDGTCLASSAPTKNFKDYLAQCPSNEDKARANNFFAGSLQNFKDIFQGLQAQYNDLIIAAESQSAIMSLSGNSTQGVDSQIDALEKKKGQLIREINRYEGTADASNRAFLDDIMHGTPKAEMFPSLQDISLGLFLFGWVTICMILVLVRWGSPGGTWRAGVFTLLLLVLVSLCVYALLVNVV